MKLVRWLLRGIAPNGRVMEPGEEMLLEDHILLSDHQVDLTAIAAGNDAATRDQAQRDAVTAREKAATEQADADLVAAREDAKQAEIARAETEKAAAEAGKPAADAERLGAAADKAAVVADHAAGGLVAAENAVAAEQVKKDERDRLVAAAPPVETPLVAEHLVAATPPVGAPAVESVPEPVFEPAPAPEPPPEG